jgi:putative transposase
VVFIPQCRRRTLYEQMRQHLVEVFRKLVAQKESRIEGGHLMPGHVHMLITIPPKCAVAQVAGVHQGQDRRTIAAWVVPQDAT